MKVELRCNCVVCNKPITDADYDRQGVVAAIGPEGTVACCVEHLTNDGPDGQEYRNTVRMMACAKSMQLLLARKRK